MAENSMRVAYSSKFDNWVEFNHSFDKGILRVCYADKNRNNMFIDRATFARCMRSIFNCPITCRYDRDLDEIGGHDMASVRDGTNEIKLVNLTTPVGVIPESANYWWEDVVEEDGTTREYLHVEALLWKHQEAYEKIKADGVVGQSMEILITEGAMKNGVFIVDDFVFYAFCLLGKYQPCYESAQLATFADAVTTQQSDEKMVAMMQDFKATFSLSQTDEKESTENLEGGEVILKEKKEILAKYGFTEDTFGFDLDSLTEEEVLSKCEELSKDGEPEKNEPEAGDDEGNEGESSEGENENAKTSEGEPEVTTTESTEATESGGSEAEAVATFALVKQFEETLVEALRSERIEDEFWGSMARYWFVDYDNELCEVYCYDNTDWRFYGFKYSVDGDNVLIDFDTKKRMKFAITEFDEGGAQEGMAAVFSLITSKCVVKCAEITTGWEQKFKLHEREFTDAKDELGVLRKFKLDTEGNEIIKRREDILAAFSDLSSFVDFDDLCAKSALMSPEELEDKCFSLRGRSQTAKFSLSAPQTIAPKLKVEREESVESDPYGGLFSKYST